MEKLAIAPWRSPLRGIPASTSTELAVRARLAPAAETLSDGCWEECGMGNVHLGEIEVSITDLESLINTIANLTRSSLPRAVSQLTVVGTSAEI